MKLVYTLSGVEVRVGDKIVTSEGIHYTVEYFRKPSSPNSSGKITVKDASGQSREYYVGVIGAKWIDRDDQDDHDGYEFDSVHGRGKNV